MDEITWKHLELLDFESSFENQIPSEICCHISFNKQLLKIVFFGKNITFTLPSEIPNESTLNLLFKTIIDNKPIGSITFTDTLMLEDSNFTDKKIW